MDFKLNEVNILLTLGCNIFKTNALNIQKALKADINGACWPTADRKVPGSNTTLTNREFL